MRNIKLVIEYDGTDFCGWQWQPKGRTVQGVLQSSLKELMQESPTIYAAGRTDAGVHALGQVANFKTENSLDLNSIKLGLNSYLPPDVRVLSAEEVIESFHARFDAVKRTYHYVISKGATAIGRQYSWFCKYDLDLARMQKASEFLLGKHSFEAFSKFNQEEEHYLSNVESARWEETKDELRFKICANRFLRNMVRIIIGTLVDVGRGKMLPEDVKEILDSKDRKRAGCVTPAQGLFLVKVEY